MALLTKPLTIPSVDKLTVDKSIDKTVPKQNRKIILDLDDTLIKSYPIKESKDLARLTEKFSQCSHFVVNLRNGNFQYESFFICVRPGAYEFLERVADGFDLIFWSAGDYGYVHAIVSKLIGSLANRPSIIYTAKDTFISEDRCTVIKDIFKLPGVTKNNAILIDDRDDVMCRAPNQGIVIKEFNPKKCETDRELDSIYARLITDEFWANLN